MLQPESYFLIRNHLPHSGWLSDAEDCRDFLHRLDHETGPLLQLCAYCLLPGQYNLLVKTTTEAAWETFFRSSNKLKRDFAVFDEPAGQLILSTLATKHFSDFIRSLPLKNNPAGSKSVFEKLAGEGLVPGVIALHHLPVQQQVAAHPSGWTFSSYNALISDKPTRLLRDEVLGWFDGVTGFKERH
jgi:putative transposase